MRYLLLGASGHGRVIADIIRRAGAGRVEGFFDDRAGLRGQALDGARVLGDTEALRAYARRRGFAAIVAIGDNALRAAKARRLTGWGLRLGVAVHPDAVVASGVELGAGTVVMAGAVLNPGVRAGANVIINTGATIDHDCVLGDAVHVSPGAHLAGGVRVGARAHVGIGACVIQNLEIGAGSVVGAGAVVVRPVAPGVTVAGVPARPLRRNRA